MFGISNNAYHRTINMKPDIYAYTYTYTHIQVHIDVENNDKDANFKVGHYVKISKYIRYR